MADKVTGQFRAESEERIRNSTAGDVVGTANRIRSGGPTGEAIAREALIAGLFVDGWLWELTGVTADDVTLLRNHGRRDECTTDWDALAVLAAKLARLVPPDDD